MISIELSDLLSAAEDVVLPANATASVGGSVPSLGIVNSLKGNGKRLRFSRALLAGINAQDSVELVPIVSKGVIMVGRKLPYRQKYSLHFSKGNIAYNASAVNGLTKVFDLDFSVHVSMTFSGISFMELPTGEPIAVVDMASSSVVSIEDDAFDDGV